MRQISCRVQIGKYEFNRVAEVKINSSYENLTDTATLTIPRKLQFEGKPITGDDGIFKTGDVVNIYLGYDFKNELIFSGFIANVKPGTPLEFRCEDLMYLLKRGALKKSFPGKIKVKALLQDILPGYNIVCPDIDLGQTRIINETPAQVLSNLNRTYGFKSWFRNGTLYCGLSYWLELQQSPPPVFVFSGRQANIIEHDLTYQDKESVRLKVTAISINPDNSKTEIEIGDPEGEQRTLTYYNVSKKDLTEFAKLDLEKFRYTGFRGTFTTFGSPVVRHGDIVQLIDPEINDRNGRYIVKSVDTTFGQRGYRQKIELEARV
jgi:hypothetical protein